MLIEMSGFSVLLQRKRVKNINLRIKRSGEIQVSAPMKTPIDTIHGFIHHKRSWIEMHRSRLQQVKQAADQHLIAGEFIPFQGINYGMHLHETSTNQRIQLNENQIHFFVKRGASQADKERLLTKWYRHQMDDILPPLLDKWQSIMGVTVNQVSIRRMTSRWGSCHPTKKNITLNLRLIEKPLRCLEYVIVHELVHLFEVRHNQRFYALMTHYLSDWKQIKKQLR
jgi:predicted metal-dependent hydrolase